MLICLGIAPGHAEKRVALVIGNKDYKPGVGALVNPLNDIRVVGDALKSVGFELLTPVQNATRTEMLSGVYEFASKLKAAGPEAVGFLYYSGHGVASGGENYLIPVDIDEPSTVKLSIQGVRQSEVLAILRNQAPNAAHYLVLDACRNALQGARGGKGFVPVGEQSGVLVAFAAEPGRTASDTGQGSGPYAAALAAELVKPGQNDLLMFHKVRIAVINKTGGDQIPWTEDGIQRPDRPMFAGENKPVATAPSTQPATAGEAAQAWAMAQNTTSVAVLEEFIRRFGGSFYAALARARLDDLKKAQLAAMVPPTMPASPCGGVTLASLSSRSAQPLSANEECALKPKDVFRECDKCPEMVVIPAGSFTMGSPASEERHGSDEEPQHSVTIAKRFAAGRFAVTFDEWAACVAGGGCNGYEPSDPLGWGRGRQPVIRVSWDDAKAYVAWLSRKTGKPYRLLSEAEREYVTRAGTTTTFWWGASISTSQANYDGRYTYAGGPKGEFRQKTVPVDTFQPNPWGLYQVHGNVYEWVEDCWHDSYTGAPSDGSPWVSGECKYRVIRGGSWNWLPWYIRAAWRSSGSPDQRLYVGGFRLARAL
ncbi:MAG: SUMF1/EgtB/PvdO family nonheme iron enzyme [Xanthobacteraceae bacterium]